MAGGSVSIMVTVKVQRLVLPLVSVATQVTAVAPRGKRVPEGGEQTAVAEPQLSDATRANETIWSHRPGVLLVRMFAGQVITGASRSWTMTRKAHAPVFPLGSPAVQLTVLVPFEKLLPDGGAHVTGTVAQLSVAVTSKLPIAVHFPAVVFRVTSTGQEMTGRSASFNVTVNEQVCSLLLLS